MSPEKRTLSRVAAAAALLLGATLLGACGTEAADEPPASTPAPGGTGATGATEPLCSEVWVDGQVLEKPYAGCHDDDADSWVDAEVMRCSSGQRIVTYADSFYAVPGREIVGVGGPLTEDPDFTQMLATCTA